MRIREYSQDVPKPMIPVGYRPILWHIMKYYAHYGHTDFVLCLGYQADVIKQYFLTYNECVSNDFVLSEGGEKLELLTSDIQDWRITFVDTGPNASVGERLMAVRKHLEGEEMFMANYADCLTDVHLPSMIDHFKAHGKVASFMGIRPNYTFHVFSMAQDQTVEDFQAIKDVNMWINGGFFIFKQAIFEYMEEGEELVEAPFRRLINDRELVSFNHEGFWACMDTFKEQKLLEGMQLSGEAPWEVWHHESTTDETPATPDLVPWRACG